MGMFSSLFGSAGSDKADKLRAQALDAFNSVKTPELSSLQIELDKYVQAGTLTPDQAEATLLNSNAFNDIKTDPSLVGAQKQALQQLQTTANEGGLTAIDRAKIQDIQDTLNTTARGRNQAVLQNARERGIGGSGLELQNQLMNEQSAADQASRAGTDVAAQAQARALQALQSAGTLGGQMESQQYGEQANKATAQNAIDKFNAETSNATNLYNVGTSNQAQAANLTNKQAVENANVAAENANKQYNAQQNQTVYQDELAKAQGKSGVLTGWANDASQQAAAEHGADMALTGGLLNAGATALTAGMSGPAAGAVTGTVSSNPQFGTTYKPTNKEMGYSEGGIIKDQKVNRNMGSYAEGGEIKMDADDFENEHTHLLNVLRNPSDSKLKAEYDKQKEEMKEEGYNCGGSVHDMRDGGKVPGQPKVSGDSPKNDIVPAMLSPGEVVVPRTKVNDEDEFNNFMSQVRQNKMAQGGPVKPPMAPPMPPVGPAVPPPAAPPAQSPDMIGTVLKSLQQRVTNLEGGR